MKSFVEFLDQLRTAAERDIEVALHRAHLMSPLIMPAEMQELFNRMPDVMTGEATLAGSMAR